MLGIFKNALSSSKKSDASASTVATNPPDAHGTLKGAQMLLGRMTKQWERQVDELTNAKVRLAELERTLGQQLLDEDDHAHTAQSIQSAETSVRQFERMVAEALLRKQDAETKLKNAEQVALLDAEAAALARLRAVAVRGDRILSDLESLVREEFTPALAAAYAATATCGRSEGQTAFLNAFRDAFVLCVKRACTPFIPDGRAGLPGFKDRKWSSWMSDQDPMGTRPR